MHLGTIWAKGYRLISKNLLVARFRPVFDEVVLPFRLVRIGNLGLLLYICIWVSIAFVFYSEGIKLIVPAVREALVTAKAPLWLFGTLVISFKLLLYYLLIPAGIVLIALPVRVLWIYGTLRPLITIKESCLGYLLALHTVTLSIRYCLYKLFPALALLAIYLFFTYKVKNDITYALFLTISVLAWVHGIYSIFPMLFAPYISVCGQITPIVALQISEQILRPKALYFLGILSVGAALTVAASLIMYGRALPRWSMLTPGQIAFYVSVLWYTLTLFSFACMRIIAVKP